MTQDRTPKETRTTVLAGRRDLGPIPVLAQSRDANYLTIRPLLEAHLPVLRSGRLFLDLVP
jgi:hypothetical protein